MRLFYMFATTAALFGLLVGCSAKRLPDYSPFPAHQYTHKDTQNGLAVAIHPMTQESEIEQYFGTNLLAVDILPILVVAENQNVDTSFILRKQEIQLLNENTQSHDATKRSGEAGASAADVAVAVIFVPWGGTLISQGAEVRRNFMMKELQQITVSPGDAKSGFVYFQLPKPKDSPNRWRLQIQVLNLKNKMPLIFFYDFDWERS